MSDSPHGEDCDCMVIEVLVKVYLRHRDDPILAPTTLTIPHGSMFETADDVSDYCMSVLLEDLDARSARVLVLGDTRNDKRLFIIDEIQHIVVHAPENFVPDLPEEIDE